MPRMTTRFCLCDALYHIDFPDLSGYYASEVQGMQIQRLKTTQPFNQNNPIRRSALDGSPVSHEFAGRTIRPDPYRNRSAGGPSESTLLSTRCLLISSLSK